MAVFRSISLFAGSAGVLAFLFLVLRPAQVVSENPASLAQEFIGSQACAECHAEPELSGAGFNIWEEAHKEAHSFALSLPDPRFPEGTNEEEVILPPDGSSWDDYAYVMGGYGWKTTFIRKDGSQITGSANAQYNLETREWVAYHPGDVLNFDVECSRCHTTGTTTEGSWNGNPADSLGTFTEIGVQCEGCHGPSSMHATRRFTTSEGETNVLQDRCGDCHNNGGRESPIPGIDGFIINHAQYQEMEASRHGSISFFTCTTCHEPHVALKFSNVVGKTFSGKDINPIRNQCQDCHPTRVANHPAPIECVDCHMPKAGKSAVGIEYANGGARGDIASHVWRINTADVPRDSMFTEDGAFVKPDASGWLSVTLDFACLGCHTDADETLAWASEYAKNVHTPAGVSVEEPDPELPARARIVSNYPNPFAERTTIVFELREPAPITIGVYNSSGQRIALLDEGERSAGQHTVSWDGLSDAGLAVSSGVYIARLQAGPAVSTHKILLVK